MSKDHVSVIEPELEEARSNVRRAFDFLDRIVGVFLISANLMFLLFALTAGAAECAATASFIDDPDLLARFTATARVQCAVSPAVRALIILFGGNALYISGIFARQTPIRLRWRWLPRKRQQVAATNTAAAPAMNGQTSPQLTQ